MKPRLDALLQKLRDKGIDVRVVKDFDDFIQGLRARGVSLHPTAEQTAGALYIDTRQSSGGDLDGYGEHVIAIRLSDDVGLSYSQAIHEFGHFKCSVARCPCASPDWFHPLAEAHAHQFVLTCLGDFNDVVRQRYICRIAKEAVEFFESDGPEGTLRGHLIALILKADSGRNRLIETLPSGLDKAESEGYGAYCDMVKPDMSKIASDIGIASNQFGEKSEAIREFVCSFN
jgi:hypothetical protein